MNFTYNDGGRADAGFKGNAGDCVTRAIAIATETPYMEVYESLRTIAKEYAETKRDRVSRNIQRKGTTPRNGVNRKIYQAYLESLGWTWVPTMTIGSGCTVHLKENELPKGRLIARVSSHLSAVVDGVIQDTHNPSTGYGGVKDGRCVYGYFIKEGGK